jgi:hypothetical protein
MFSALKPALEELAKNAKKAPGWAPLAVVCYFAFYLLFDRDVLGLSMAEESKKFLVEHKELLVVGATFLLYILGDGLDKFLWKRLEPQRIDAPRRNVAKALGIGQDYGLYRVSKALAERAKKYEGSWIQVKNESAKTFRSLVVLCGLACIPLMVTDNWVLAVGALLGVAAFAPMYIDLKAEHICDLYVLTTDALSKPPKFVMHDVPGWVRLFFWDGEFASSAERPKLEICGKLRISEPGEASKTVGRFSQFVRNNAAVFRDHFKEDLFPGSLNVDVVKPYLQSDLDAGLPTPTFVIPRNKLIGMPEYIEDGQAWSCTLQSDSMTSPVRCWIFRRIGSRVPSGVIELVARVPLVTTHQLRDGDSVVIHVV